MASNGENGRHQEVGHKSLLQSDALYQILAMDINRENYEIGLPVIEKAGLAHKIEFREGPALPVLDQMIEDGKYHGTYDFIFVDADKDNYLNYHKRLIDLVKYYRDFVLELNKALAVDPRIEICQLPVGDGITQPPHQQIFIQCCWWQLIKKGMP
ncbi:hypothetical protein HAX54_019920 [Datura stramonium]|uniref:caffeoyl-CoA O-methyltransferase n=1 Tax=Datura stramonium TaxID=4076 RepID=A0ABS8S2C1_DATST|nr:hypothetical protein [Datura stramonium]